MPSIQIIGVGTSDLTALKRNFANLLQEKFGSKPTLAEAIARKGLDEKHEISLLRRRARYAKRQDRPKVFASTPNHLISGYGYPANHNPARDRDLLSWCTNTTEYVAAWTRLNHLKEA